MTETAARPGAAPDKHASTTRQLISFAFYKVMPEWRRLPRDERERQRRQLLDLVDAVEPTTVIRSYSTQGLRGDVDFLLWSVADTPEQLNALGRTIASSDLAGYLTTPHHYLAMTRRSIYVGGHHHAGQDGRRTRLRPAGSRYLFVYPFVKTHAWYQLPFAERQRMMDEHIKIGHEFPSIKINTTYSYGLDDQEFVVAFETDQPGDFLDLVMKLRTAEQRPYTERDTPIFSCIAMPLEELLDGPALER